MQGMALGIQHTNLPVIVQSGSSEALSSLTTDGLDRSAYGHLVYEIKELMEAREFIPQKLIRDQNRVVDCLAKYSCTDCATAVWMHQGPSCIEDLLPLHCNSLNMK
ncbi:hypothetical protein VPH35_057575 [Triticum aestivum]